MGLHVLTRFTAALTAGAMLTGCGAEKAATPADPPADPQMSASAPAPASASAAPTTTAPRIEKWTALKPGDCLADAPPTDPAVATVTVVDCAVPHLAETYLRADIPVDAALDDVATAQCDPGFVGYTGQDLGTSPYTVTYLIDSDQDRTFNNPYPSTVICLLQDAQGRSLAGSAKR